MNKQKLSAIIAKLGLDEETKNGLMSELVGSSGEDTYKVRPLVQITFADKPSKEVRDEMKKCEFHWNAFEKVWQAYLRDEVTALLKKLNIKEG